MEEAFCSSSSADRGGKSSDAMRDSELTIGTDGEEGIEDAGELMDPGRFGTASRDSPSSGGALSDAEEVYNMRREVFLCLCPLASPSEDKAREAPESAVGSVLWLATSEEGVMLVDVLGIASPLERSGT